MDNSALITIGVIVGIAVTAILMPIFLKRPWTVLFLPWIIPNLKGFLLDKVPATRVIDISVLILAFLIVFLIFGFLSKKLVWDKRYTVLLLLHFVVAALLGISCTWTTAPMYGGRKAAIFATFNTVWFIIGVAAIRSVADSRKVAKGYSLIALLFSAMMIVSPSYAYTSQYELRQSIGGTSPLNTAFIIAVGAVSGLVWFARKKQLMCFSGVILVASIIGISKAGARACLVQVLLGVAMLSVIFKGTNRKFRIAILTLAVFFGIAVGGPLILAKGGGRMAEFIQDPAKTLLENERIWLWTEALHGIPEKPIFGHGSGAFAMNVLNQDKMAFPHNFFLEIFYEGGFISLVFFVMFWLLMTRYTLSWRKLTPDGGILSDLYVRDMWIVIFFASAAGSVFHWDLSGQRLLWLLGGIMMGTARAAWQEGVYNQWYCDSYYFDETQAEQGLELETDAYAMYVE